MMINSEVQKPDNATLVLRRLLKAPQERAFKAWTSPEHIQKWMRPEPGMVVPSVLMDLRAGGKFRIQMKNPDGEVLHGRRGIPRGKGSRTAWFIPGIGRRMAGERVWRGGGKNVANHRGVSQARRADGLRNDSYTFCHRAEPGCSRRRLDSGAGELRDIPRAITSHCVEARPQLT